MRVFVTGGTGFIGSHIVRALVARGDQVTVFSRRGFEFPWPVSVVFSLDSLAGHDALIHCALVWGDEAEELQFRDVEATGSLFEAAVSSQVGHFIYTSSVAVHRPFSDQMDENSPMNPPDLYGQTKVRGEQLLRELAAVTGVRLNIVRPGPTVGALSFPGAGHRSDRRFIEFIQDAIRGEEITVQAGEGRQLTSVMDLATAYLALLDSDEDGEAFIAVAPEATTWESIAKHSVQVAGTRSRVLALEPAVANPTFSAAKLERRLGVSLNTGPDLREHIEHLWKTIKSQTSSLP